MQEDWGRQDVEQCQRVEKEDLPCWALVCDHLSSHKMMRIAKHFSSLLACRLSEFSQLCEAGTIIPYMIGNEPAAHGQINTSEAVSLQDPCLFVLLRFTDMQKWRQLSKKDPAITEHQQWPL